VDEVLNHAIGVGMIDIEAVKLAIGGQVNTRLPLKVEDDASRIDQRLLARECHQPIGYRIRTHGRAEDSGVLLGGWHTFCP
jgi:hypothetical protein